MKTPLFSLLILNYNQPDLALARLLDVQLFLQQHIGETLEVIFIDNGSTEQPNVYYNDKRMIAAGIAPDLIHEGHVKVVSIPENDGFGGGFRQGAKAASGEYLILYSNDVEMRGDWFGPNYQDFARCCDAGNLVCHRKISFNSGWNEFASRVIPYGEGYFLMLSKSLWDEIGGFDKRYHPYDYEDIDLSMEVMERSGRGEQAVISFAHLPLHHRCAGTIGYGNARMEHTIKMRALFAEKWGLVNIPERP